LVTANASLKPFKHQKTKHTELDAPKDVAGIVKARCQLGCCLIQAVPKQHRLLELLLLYSYY